MPNNSDKGILVTGATGTQGGAVARHLIAAGFRVRAFTRDASQEAARQLADAAGTEVVEGNLKTALPSTPRSRTCGASTLCKRSWKEASRAK